jgi:hypothetical protein
VARLAGERRAAALPRAPGSNFIALDEHSGGDGAMSSVAV